MPKRILYGAKTDIGKFRQSNQDAIFASLIHPESPAVGIFIVADGMSVESDGEQASQLACEVISAYVQQHFLPPFTSEQLPDLLTTAFQQANKKVAQTVPDVGTTTTTVVLVDDIVCIAHVGDSAVYLVSQEKCERLTKVHDFLHYLIDKGLIDPDDWGHPMRNSLYRVLGQEDAIEVDIHIHKLLSNEILIICSDGFWWQLPKPQIQQIVLSSQPESACEILVNIANENSGYDNISVIVVQVAEG